MASKSCYAKCRTSQVLVAHAYEWMHCEKDGSGRILYEIGAAVPVLREQEIWGTLDRKEKFACERAAAVYACCNAEAKRAVMCWLWLSPAKNVVKDIRLLIADLVWEERAAWSDLSSNAKLAADVLSLVGSVSSKRPKL